MVTNLSVNNTSDILYEQTANEYHIIDASRQVSCTFQSAANGKPAYITISDFEELTERGMSGMANDLP